MRRLTIYVSGPIHGQPEGNKQAFRNAAGVIKRFGHIPMLPHEIPPFQHEGECPKGYSYDSGHSSCCWLRGDLLAMLKSANAIYMLGDWQHSRGAVLEHNVATLTGLGLYYEFGLIPFPPAPKDVPSV